MNEITDRDREYINDALADCGCYEVGGYRYDRLGNKTHSPEEECNN